MRDINVYGQIGGYYDEDVTASDFAKELKKADGEDVTIHINSGGGNVFDANTMAELLRSYKGHSTASIEGLAASAASYFALTADEVVINPSALVMIHNPATFSFGTADDMRKSADMLDKVRSTISGQYASKTGREVSEIESLMDEETWFTADEAVEFGLADRMTDCEPIAACIDKETLDRFRNAPESLSTDPVEPAGEQRTTIAEATVQPTDGASEVRAGSATRVVCVNGAFLKVEGDTQGSFHD